MDDNNENNEELNEQLDNIQPEQQIQNEQDQQSSSEQMPRNSIVEQTAKQQAGKVANAAGDVAKDGVKKAASAAGKAAKKAIMGLIKAIGIKALVIFLVIIIVAACVWGVISSIFDALSNVVEGLGNSYVATSGNSNFEDGINITDEQIQQLVDEIEKNGISAEDLYLCGDIDYSKEADDPANIEQRNKYLRKFLLAQLCTYYPDFGIQEDETHYNGIIKIKRASNTSNLEDATDMEYVRKDIFDAMITAINNNSIDAVTSISFTSQRTDTTINSLREGSGIPAIIFYPEGAENVPLVLMCHGFTGKKEGDNDHFITLGNLLAQNGIAAITIDFSGCGASADPSTSYTLQNMQADMDAAIAYMQTNFSIDGNMVGVVGHSMGGRLASENLNKFQAAALWAPANGDGLSGLEFLGDYNSLYQTAQSNGTVDSGWDSNGRDFILSKEFFDEMSNSHPQQKISNYSNPLLVAYGTQDAVISSEVQNAVEAAMPSQGTFLKYNEDHNFTLGNGENELINETANLFCEAFLGRGVNEGGNSTENPLAGYTIEELRERIRNVYSIDNNGNLYFAVWNIVESSDGTNTTTTYTVEAKTINYSKTVEKYGLPIEVSLALCMMTQNPEYVSDFIDEHVLSGEIVITILDTQLVDTHENWYDWIVREVTTTINQVTGDSSNSTNNVATSKYAYNKTITTNVTSTVEITHVDTWMASSDISYTNTQDMIEYPLGEETVVKNVDCPVDIQTSDSYTRVETTDSGPITYSVSISRSVTSSTHTDIENIVYNEWERGTVTVDTDAMQQKADSIIAQWQQKYTIPNSTNRKDAPITKLMTSKEMFLELLNHENTQKQLQTFKFLIERAQDPNYTIANLDTSIYKDIELIVVDATNDIIVDITRSNSEIVLDIEEIQEAIEQCFSGEQEENLLNTLQTIYDVQSENKVNAVFTIAVAVQESSAGTNWDLIDSSTYNWMSMQAEKGYVDRNGTTWASYSSFAAATRAFGTLISTSNNYFGGGNYSVTSIAQKYCVPPEGWANGVISTMTRMYTALGIDISNKNTSSDDNRVPHGSPGVPGGSVSGSVELDGSYNVNGVLLSNPIKDPISNIGSRPGHGAVDINPTQNGGTPVYAAADGVVTTAGYHSSYGNYVIIDHGNGVSTLYAHASSLVVSSGQSVTRGTLIMYEGSTGNSTGPHVHFEIRINGQRNQSLAEDMFRQMGYTISAQ